MSKRFTDTEKWERQWFRELPVEYKMFWSYLCDRCDQAGIWPVDMPLAEYMIKGKIDLQKAIEMFNNGKDRVRLVGTKLVLIHFPEFQYGSFRKSKHAFHRQLAKSIDSVGKNTLLDTLSDRVQEKDKDKVQEKEQVQVAKPDWIRQDAWDGFVEMRRQIKKPLEKLTGRGFSLFIQTLERLRAAGDDPNEVLNQSVAHNWQGVFPLKKNGGADGRATTAGHATPAGKKYDW